MGDFESVFGADADAADIIDSFSNSEMHVRSERKRERNLQEEGVFWQINIERNNYCLNFESYREYKKWEASSRDGFGNYLAEFSCFRYGDGFQVRVNPKRIDSFFEKSGRIIMVPSDELGFSYVDQFGGNFYIICKYLRPFERPKKLQERTLRTSLPDDFEIDRHIFRRILRSLSEGQDVVVGGHSGDFAIHDSGARFFGWTGISDPQQLHSKAMISNFEYDPRFFCINRPSGSFDDDYFAVDAISAYQWIHSYHKDIKHKAEMSHFLSNKTKRELKSIEMRRPRRNPRLRGTLRIN